MLVVLKYRPNSIFANIQPVIKPFDNWLDVCIHDTIGCLATNDAIYIDSFDTKLHF